MVDRPCKYGYINIMAEHDFKISIIGLGKLGRALSDQLTGCKVVGWDVIDTGLDIQTDTLYEAIQDVDVIFIVVPSDHFQETLMNIISEYARHKDWHTATNVKIVSFTKGFCNGRLPIEALKRELPFNPVGVVSGPMLSEEMYTGHTYAMLASDNMDTHQMSAICTRMSNLHLHHTTDVTGVTLCGIVKNVYAVGMGMLAGGKYGDNLRACLATRALNEMEQLIGNTSLSYAGIGDFLTTCYSSKSRNYTYGYEWAKGHNTDGIMSILFVANIAYVLS